MAKIPVLQSQGKINTPNLGRSSRVQPVAEYSGQGEGLQAIGETVSKLSGHFEKIISQNQITKAEIEARRQLSELETEAETSKELDPKIYQERINKIKTDTSSSISLPYARDEYSSQFGRLSVISDFNIRRTLNNRRIEEALYLNSQYNDELKNSYLKAKSEPEMNTVIQDMYSGVDKMVDNLIITKLKAKEMKEKTLKEWQTDTVRERIAENPEGAKESLLKGDFSLTADETAKWLDVAGKQIERKQKEILDIRDKMWLENGANVISNLENTTVSDLILMVSKGQINPDIAKDLIDWKTNPDTVSYETDKKIFMNLAEKSVDTNTDLRNFNNELAKAIADKKITAVDAANLSVLVKQYFKDAVNFKTPPNTLVSNLKVALGMFVMTGLPNIAYIAVKQLIEKIKGGLATDDIPVKAEEIIKKEIYSQADQNKSKPIIFNSVEEAENSGLEKGTEIMINGRKAVIE